MDIEELQTLFEIKRIIITSISDENKILELNELLTKYVSQIEERVRAER